MIDIVHSAMLERQRITTRKLSDELGLLFGLVQSILKEDMDMKHVSENCPISSDSQAEREAPCSRQICCIVLIRMQTS